MRKAIMYTVTICILFILTFFAFKSSEAQQKIESTGSHKGPTVTISGKVTFPGYKEGQRIRVNAKSSQTQGFADIASIDLPEPGSYSLKVPQNIGKVFISTVVLQPGEVNPTRDSLGRAYSKNPLQIKRSEIKEINIEIGGSLMVDTYVGSAVTISGKITFPAYKEGQQIRVSAKSYPDEGPPDIASVGISGLGEYSLKVPKNSGDVYITAVVLQPGQISPGKGSPKIKYNKGLPVKVEASDISGIDIAI